MQVPFTVEQFFGVFRTYNSAVWPAQILLLVLAALAVIFIAFRRSWSGVAVSAILAVLWIWLDAAYHLAFFARINPVAYGFGAMSIVGGLMFAWHGVIRRRLEFSFVKSLRAGIGITLLLFALLVYPIWATLAFLPFTSPACSVCGSFTFLNRTVRIATQGPAARHRLGRRHPAAIGPRFDRRAAASPRRSGGHWSVRTRPAHRTFHRRSDTRPSLL